MTRMKTEITDMNGVRISVETTPQNKVQATIHLPKDWMAVHLTGMQAVELSRALMSAVSELERE